VRKKGMREIKLSYIGAILSSDTAGTKVWNCLQDVTAQIVVINMQSSGNLKSTAGPSMNVWVINLTAWTSA
jgi:hypothetical protein